MSTVSNSAPSRTSLSKPVLVWWWAGFACSLPLFLRLLYEQTLLTWSSGPQAVGFTFGHRFPAILMLGLMAHLSMALWLLVVAVHFIKRRAWPRGASLAMVLITVVGLVVVFTPYSFWQAVGH